MTTWTTLAHTTATLRALGTLCLALCLFSTANTTHAMRIKEVAAVEGVRSNQLTGFGLIVGLDGTGDQTTQMPYTTQGLTNYLQQLGVAPGIGADTGAGATSRQVGRPECQAFHGFRRHHHGKTYRLQRRQRVQQLL